MILQIAIGTGLILLTVLVSGLSYLVMEALFLRLHRWLAREPHAIKQMLVLCATSLWIVGLITIAVWIWALTFIGLGLFPTLEEALYFALVSFTTLGYGDVLLHSDWRLLSGMIAANGLLNFGMFTAILIEVMRQLRLAQIRTKHGG